MRRKISVHVDGGPSGGSRVRRPGSEDPHRRGRKSYQALVSNKSIPKLGEECTDACVLYILVILSSDHEGLEIRTPMAASNSNNFFSLNGWGEVFNPNVFQYKWAHTVYK